MNRQDKYSDKPAPRQPITPTAILNIISRTTESLPGRDEPLSAKFKELDACIRFENGVTDTLADVVYQDAPGVGQRLDYLLDSLEQICLYPELDARPAYLLAAKNIGALFLTFAFLFENDVPKQFLKYNTTPVLIVDDRETSLELVNFANARISGLDFEYYGALLDGCAAQKIAVNQMVKMFILHIPLKISGACLVFDGISGVMKKRLARFLVDNSCLVKNEAELDAALKRKFDRVIVDCNTNREFHDGMIGFQDFRDGFPFDRRVPIYGFYEEFLYEKNHVMIHYHREIAKKEEMSKALRDDSVHLDNDQTLEDLRQRERDIKKKLESDARQVEECFSTVEKCLDDIRRLLLRDIMSEERVVPHRVANQVFTMFFEAVDANYDEGVETAISRMRALKLRQLPMAEEFYRTKKDKSDDSTTIAQWAHNWIESKMLLDRFVFPRDGRELSPIARNMLQKLLGYIVRHKSSGKEYYAEFLITGDQKSLWKAMELGYQEAGTRLYELNRDNTDALKKLATYLVPEACFALAQKDVSRYLKAQVGAMPADNRTTDAADYLAFFLDQLYLPIMGMHLSSKNLDNENQHKQYDQPCKYCNINFAAKSFFYLKIAASLRYPPALEYMAKMFYSLFFTSCELLDTENPDPARLKFGNLIIAIFRSGKLGSQNIHMEIHGVTAFCLGQFEDANKLLLHVNTPRAKYCRGYMYWQGLGCGRDLAQALSLMKEAGEDFPLARNAWRRIQNTINARQRTNYNPDSDYHTTRSTSCSSSSCMIIAALGVACNSSPIKQMHTFAHRELGGTECGKAMIREYYRTGGLLIRRLAGHPEARVEYERIRKDFLCGTLSKVHSRDYRAAAESMIHMQIGLCEKYGISIDEKVISLMKNDGRYSECFEDVDSNDVTQS